MKPLLKWAGGKSWMVDLLRPHYAQHQSRLVEPFCGGAAVTFGLQPKTALLNDWNSHLMHFYAEVKRNGLPMKLHTYSNLNTAEVYYIQRQAFNEILKHRNKLDLAELFYYLNKTGFNGLCRFNSSGEFNVPFGRYAKINYAENFKEYQPLMRQWELRSTDFAMLDLQPDDFVYADPPYDGVYNQYTDIPFEWPDHVRLAEWLAEHHGPVVVSNSATEQVTKLYSSLGFKMRLLSRKRTIAAGAEHRLNAMEMIAWKNIVGSV